MPRRKLSDHSGSLEEAFEAEKAANTPRYQAVKKEASDILTGGGQGIPPETYARRRRHGLFNIGIRVGHH